MNERIYTGLDFDGTVTDVVREARPYQEGYRADVAAHLGLSEEELKGAWDQVATEIEAAPTQFGWKDPGTGRIVAPATADPLLLTRVTAETLLTKLQQDPTILGIDPARRLTDSLPKTPQDLHLLLESFFGANYGKQETHFRPGAAEFLMQLLELGRLTVITNSKTKGVLAKLDTLRKAHPTLPEVDVRGEAEKFTLASDWHIEGLPTELDCTPDLARPVYTQRRKYFEVLRESGVLDAASSVVAGDVWELDLMLPRLLGMKGAFITRETTPEHEKAIVARDAASGKMRMSSDLDGLLADIRELHAR